MLVINVLINENFIVIMVRILREVIVVIGVDVVIDVGSLFIVERVGI